MPEKKAVVMNADDIGRALTRITAEIAEKDQTASALVLVGIRTRGVYIASRIAQKLHQLTGRVPPVIALDTTPWRDDLPRMRGAPPVREPQIEGAQVIIVDDVLYTGRTVRAAMEAVSQMGRAGSIQLAVLVDRGHREVPIRPNFIGKNVPTQKGERVCVRLTEVDGVDDVQILRNQPATAGD